MIFCDLKHNSLNVKRSINTSINHNEHGGVSAVPDRVLNILRGCDPLALFESVVHLILTSIQQMNIPTNL